MAPDSAASSVLAGLADVRSWQEELYRDVHRHPELSHQEHGTAALLAQRLRGAGYAVHEGVGGTGVVGVLRNGAGPGVLLRADMDALPVQEATGLSYASEVTTTDAEGNELPVMHACGHDVHVAASPARRRCSPMAGRAGRARWSCSSNRPRRPAMGHGRWSRTDSPT